MEHQPGQLNSEVCHREGRTGRSPRNSFTLLELLIVIAVMLVVSALAVPAVTSLLTSYNLATGADMVLSQLGFARQSALAIDHTVEVRFYRFAIQGMPGELPSNPASGKFRAFQIFQFASSGVALPLTKVEQLPTGIIFDSGTLSSLLAASQQKTFNPPLDSQVSLPECGTSYSCAAFRVSAAGNTSLAPAQWFVTLHTRAAGDALTAPPPNYATIQIDPVSGVVRLYRP